MVDSEPDFKIGRIIDFHLRAEDFVDDFPFRFCFDLELLVNPKLGITPHFRVVLTALNYSVKYLVIITKCAILRTF